MSKQCKSCGVAIPGLRNQQYCASCRAERKRDQNRRHKSVGPARPLGSSDQCARCGNTYTVVGGNQKYCPDCTRDAYLDVDRQGGMQYYASNKDTINPARKLSRRKVYVCAWCGKEYAAEGTRQKTCSSECKRLHYNWRMGVNRGRKGRGG